MNFFIFKNYCLNLQTPLFLKPSNYKFRQRWKKHLYSRCVLRLSKCFVVIEFNDRSFLFDVSIRDYCVVKCARKVVSKKQPIVQSFVRFLFPLPLIPNSLVVLNERLSASKHDQHHVIAVNMQKIYIFSLSLTYIFMILNLRMFQPRFLQ